LQGWILGSADVQGIESLTALQALHIKGTTNFPTGLRCLSALTALRSLTLEEIDYPTTIPQEFCGLSRCANRRVLYDTVQSERVTRVTPYSLKGEKTGTPMGVD